MVLAVLCFVLTVLSRPTGDRLPSEIGWHRLWILLSTLWCLGLGAAHWRHR